MIDTLLEKNLLPDFAVRLGIRALIRNRMKIEKENFHNGSKDKLISELKQMPVAVHTESANNQHYEVPSEFFKLCLGKNLKYSCCYWPLGTNTLDDAEIRMLELTCKRANIQDGQEILELGCGWGAVSLWIAKNYPNSKIVAVSNSGRQREYIVGQSRELNLKNLTVVTCDINKFRISRQFDRVVSVEMFEHMKNYEELMQRISLWLKIDGKLFVHIFTHKKYAYHFEIEGAFNWLGRHFFSGGTMPSKDLLGCFNQDLKIEKQWQVNGMHYHRTAEAWLNNMKRHSADIKKIFSYTYGSNQVIKWWSYWKIFFMACSELWKTNKGTEWAVSHYLFKRIVNLPES